MATEGLELTARPRSVTGKKTRFLRRQGITPANIYGHGVDSVAIEVETLPLRKVLREAGQTTLINLTVEGTRESNTVMVREVQKDAITGTFLHVNFYQVRMTERMRIEIPVHIVGVSPAVQRGDGILIQAMRTIEIEALPGDLPSGIEVDVSALEEVHSSIYVKDLTVPGKDIIILSDPDEAVVSVAAARIQEEEIAEAATAEPEIVEREREEEEEEKE